MRWKERWNRDGGEGELLRLAVPLVLSSSFLTLQVAIDRALLSQSSSAEVAASMPAAALYWTIFALLQNTANYATTFVAQYLGAGRPGRVGPVIWQSLYFSVIGGILFLGLLPVTEAIFALGGHSPEVQQAESAYFRCLCFAALPALIVASVNSFFAGRGDSWTVLIIDAIGLSVNAVLAYALIFGHFGLPALGIVGAGWATVFGSSVSALVGLMLLFRRRHRAVFATLDGWRFDAALFRRLLRFGLPAGLQFMLDMLAFTAFLFLVGRLGEPELAASNIAFTINLVALLPMLGMAQGVCVLVGQRLGQNKPELAERSTYSGLRLTALYMGTIAILYVVVPGAFLHFFRSYDEAGRRVADMVPVLLRFVALYALFDSMNLIFCFALRGAGDTRFVTIVALALAWPIMVGPSYAAWHFGWGLYWDWTFASVYVISLAFTFLFRFRAGKWKSMRVIEPAFLDSPLPQGAAATPVHDEIVKAEGAGEAFLA